MTRVLRRDTPAGASADGEYADVIGDANGQLWTADGGPGWTATHGIAGVPFTSADQHSAVASVTSAPTASTKKLVITDIFVSVDTAMNVTFKEETSGTVICGPFYLPANGSAQFTPRSDAWKLPVANKKLQVLTSVAGNIMVDAHYYSEA